MSLKIYSVHNINTYVNTFSFSKKLLLGKNTFFMEYLRATASSRYPPEKLFRKFLKNSPENTRSSWRSCIHAQLYSIFKVTIIFFCFKKKISYRKEVIAIISKVIAIEHFGDEPKAQETQEVKEQHAKFGTISSF